MKETYFIIMQYPDGDNYIRDLIYGTEKDAINHYNIITKKICNEIVNSDIVGINDKIKQIILNDDVLCTIQLIKANSLIGMWYRKLKTTNM